MTPLKGSPPQEAPELTEIIDESHLQSSRTLHERFESAQPFRHVFFEKFLQQHFVEEIVSEFPLPLEEDMNDEFGEKTRKHAVRDIWKLGRAFEKWHQILQSDTWLTWLGEVTGIEGLIYDPEYHGAGTHNNFHGQGMMPHVDFNLHRSTGYHRRLNLIVYLNEGWRPEWGGELELHTDPWDRDNNQFVSYPVGLNNAVLFETNEYSWHGFKRINLPQDRRHTISRRSLTVYYYTKDRPRSEKAAKHGTIYVPPALPSDIQVGTVIDDEANERLRDIFEARDIYLKGLYRRESDLSIRIENLLRQARLTGANQLIPSSRSALQLESEGLDFSMKVRKRCRATFRSLTLLNRVTVCGFVPPFVDGGKNTVRVSIPELDVDRSVEVESSFQVEIDVDIATEQEYSINIEAEHEISPRDAGISEDARSISFVLTGIYHENRI